MSRSPALFVPLLAIACSSIKSSDLETSGIYANYTVSTSDDMTGSATAVLRAGDATSNTFVQLEAGDAITAVTEAESVPLAEAAIGDLYSYIGAMTAIPAGTTVTFDFERAAGTSAPASTVTMPDAFTLTGPVADTIYSRASDPIVVNWDPSASNDAVEVELEGNCIEDTTVAMEGDPGTYTFNVGSFDVPDGQEDTSCDGTVTVRRTRSGTLDAALTSGGTLLAVQQREVDIRLDP